MTSKRRPGTSKSSLRRPPGPHFGASGSDFPSFLVFFWDIPERKSPGAGGESPQASSIYPPPPGRRVKRWVRFCRFCRLLLCNTRPACTALPADFGPRWTHGGLRFCHPAVPNAVLELPKRPFFSSFFWTLIFGRFGSLFLRSGLILETSASQKPMFSLGKTMIYTFAPFPLPARFFIENARKGAKRSPKIE